MNALAGCCLILTSLSGLSTIDLDATRRLELEKADLDPYTAFLHLSILTLNALLLIPPDCDVEDDILHSANSSFHRTAVEDFDNMSAI